MNHRRFIMIGTGLVVALVVAVALLSLEENTTYYFFPNEAIDNRASLVDGEKFRLAGRVVERSIIHDGDAIEFDVTDGSETIHVVLSNSPPSLFGEGVPVLIEGSWEGEGFAGTNVLIRHDENYEIPEEGGPVADD